MPGEEWQGKGGESGEGSHLWADDVSICFILYALLKQGVKQEIETRGGGIQTSGDT